MNSKVLMAVLIVGVIIVSFFGGIYFIREFNVMIKRSELLETPEQLTIDERTYTLETYLWRDFMSNIGPDDTRLRANIKVLPNDTLDFPQCFDIDKLWIIHDAKLWETTFTDENPEEQGNYCAKSITNGPKWEVGILVHVIVRIYDCNGIAHYLQAKDQEIHAVH